MLVTSHSGVNSINARYDAANPSQRTNTIRALFLRNSSYLLMTRPQASLATGTRKSLGMARAAYFQESVRLDTECEALGAEVGDVI